MLQRTDTVSDSLTVEGTRIDLIAHGKGRPVLFLHAENGIEPAAAAIEELAKSAHVIAPTHPGIAGKATARLARLVMANAVGIKVGDRETRDIADIFALTEPEYFEIAYCDPNAGRRDYKSLPPAEAVAAARAREATARFAW